MSLSISPNKKEDEDFLLFPEAGRSDETLMPWLGQHDEGRLAVDVHETAGAIVVRSAIAGVQPEDIDVSVHGDTLTIRGRRHEDMEHGSRPLVRECHWGSFSRTVILPSEVDADAIGATLKDGVLTVRLPKLERARKIDIRSI